MIRVFVGTLRCGEGGYEDCLTALRCQVDVEVQHHVIADKPEREAHNELWAAWRKERGNFDMFVKLDADTVLTHSKVLCALGDLMASDPRITGIQAPLLDYFTAEYINGLNCFHPRVTFLDSSDALFCDRKVDVDHDRVIGSTQVPESLRPAGYHAYHPTDAQAFHFGLHRSLKGQQHIINLVRQAYKRDLDRPRALALLGAQCAGTFSTKGFNYHDERFQVALSAVLGRFAELQASL